jgi:CRISPR type IV-associated protein Csf3
MMFDEELATEFKGSWKKRWNSKNDHLVNFQKRVKKIRVNAGEYKSYDMPIVLHNIKQVWFYFASHDVARMEELISKYLFGIGKKTSFGQGEIEKFVIEAIDHNPFEQVIRPIPANIDDVRSGKLSVSLMGWKPPYWLPQNQTFCLNPS